MISRSSSVLDSLFFLALLCATVLGAAAIASAAVESAAVGPTATAAPATAEPVRIELALQEGGEGVSIFQRIAQQFEASHPGIHVDMYGDPRLADKLRVRILEKDFPELTNGDFGGWNLVRHGDVLNLTGALDKDVDGSRWRDVFLQGTLARYTENGQTFAVPLSYYVQTIWFNKLMFAAHGWTLPKTWPELLALCETIDSAGIPPFAFQGRYPYYAQTFVDGAYYQLAGAAAFAAQKQLKPGSFQNPAMVQALAWTQTLAQKYFQPGAMGMGHTEAQLQFFLGHTAMIACGSWLKSEMAGKIPDGFELGTFNLPAAPGGKGDPSAVLAAGGYFVAFAHSRHPAEATEFLRYLTSPAIAAEFCRERDLPIAIRGVNEKNLSADLSDLAAIIAKSRDSYGEAPGEGYPAMSQPMQDTVLSVLTGRLSPADAARKLESAAAIARRARDDPDDLPIRHVAAPVTLSVLLLAGIVYAAGGLRRRSGHVIGAPQRTLSARAALLFVGPVAVLFLVFVLVPAVQGLFWCLYQWDGLTDSKFVGLRQFRALLFNGDGFWIALRNNLYLIVVVPAFIVPLSLFLAAAVSRGVRGGRIFRSAFLLPSVMGGVATTLLWMNLYDPQAGVINAGLVAVGHSFSSIGLHAIGTWLAGFNGFAWLSQDHLYTAIVPLTVWAGFGFNFLLYLAAMENVPAELYEAAELDGATPIQQFRVVTLPLIWDVLIVSLVFLGIAGMKAFETVWLLTSQQPSTNTHVIGTLMVKAMLTDADVGRATAIAVVLLVMVLVASLVALRASRREAVEL